MVMKKKISIIAPVYNEQDVIVEFIERTQKVMDALADRYSVEFILVDDTRKDKSLEIMLARAKTDSRIRVIGFRRNYGQTYALQCGIDKAIGEIIVSLDSDTQHFPEEIPNFLAKMEEGYDVVCGWRNQRQEGLTRRWPSAVANAIIRRITGVQINDFGTTFRAYNGKLIKEIDLFGEFHRYVPALLANEGCSITQISIKNIVRSKGKSSYGIMRAFGVVLDLMLLLYLMRYMDKPLRLFGTIAFVCFLCALIILGSLIGGSFFCYVSTPRDCPGLYFTFLFLFFGALQILLTGIVSEVLCRVFFRLKNDRVYKIKIERPD
jgi:glycosyltransferase involved in cell wall biosynthesis